MFATPLRIWRSFQMTSLACGLVVLVWPAWAHDLTTLQTLTAGRKVRKYKTRTFHEPVNGMTSLFKYRDAEGPWLIKVRQAENASEVASLFAEELTGANLARIVGGPRLRRTGFLKEQNAFFLEVEEIFVGQETWTFRGCQDEACFGFMRKVFGRPLIEQLAQRFVHVLEANVAPNEHNFIFTRTDVRWIDGENWREIFDATRVEMPAALLETMRWLLKISPDHLRDFDRQFMREVLDSFIWSEEQKDAVLTHYAYQTRGIPQMMGALGSMPIKGCDVVLIEIPKEKMLLPN